MPPGALCVSALMPFDRQSTNESDMLPEMRQAQEQDLEAQFSLVQRTGDRCLGHDDYVDQNGSREVGG